MKISDVVLEMDLGGVDEADIAEIVEICKTEGCDADLIDEELLKRGYPRLFTVDYDSYDEYDSWKDDDYTSVEKFRHKKNYNE